MKAIVLNSGGVDSTTCVGIAIEKHGTENVSTLSCYYGQKHSKELECARKVAEYYDVNHYEVDLSPVMKFSNCPLLKDSTKEIAHKSYIDQIKENGEGMVETYVPFRNGLLLSAVAALAMSIYPEEEVQVYYGAHADDAAGSAYADCSVEFAQAMDKAINIGTYNKVSICSPLINWNKSQVVKEGLRLNVPYQLTWSCYEGGEKACGTCGTCIDRLKAFRDNDVEDPIEYETR
jgi:7-cyano-7-deazaguanine synthase